MKTGQMPKAILRRADGTEEEIDNISAYLFYLNRIARRTLKQLTDVDELDAEDIERVIRAMRRAVAGKRVESGPARDIRVMVKPDSGAMERYDTAIQNALQRLEYLKADMDEIETRKQEVVASVSAQSDPFTRTRGRKIPSPQRRP